MIAFSLEINILKGIFDILYTEIISLLSFKVSYFYSFFVEKANTEISQEYVDYYSESSKYVFKIRSQILSCVYFS